ncbi:hypothetical protein AVEN_100407-1 [Araneus ventricosus]|uniref:Uncharacterized protein n=1 Tax=Araneus ventricosus TaxID=182803 RepID=A0A4Y2JXE9_ARAVE|nr:hypothetical protein AVEN_100407-1 [Araneus ventricosus]
MLKQIRLKTTFRLSGFSLVISASRSEATRGYFGTDIVGLNRGQMTRTTPEVPPPLQTSAPHQWEEPSKRGSLYLRCTPAASRRVYFCSPSTVAMDKS